MKPIRVFTLVLVLGALSASGHAQDDSDRQDDADAETWLPTLITDTPQDGFALAVTLTRKGVGTTQPDTGVLKNLRPAYAHDPDA